MENKSHLDLIAIRQLYKSKLDFDLTDVKNSEHTFYKNYKSLLNLDPISEEFRYILLHNLFGPIQYLEELHKLSEKKYRTWKKRLIKNKQSVGIYGDLFELYITWTLVMKNIDFVLSDSPDFEILHNDSKVYIECTSSQFDFEKTPSKEDILLKITTSVFNKMKLNYATISTGLFVDITNLCYHSKLLNSPITQQDLISSVLNASKKIEDFNNLNTFGAVMFFWINIIKDSNENIRYACNSYDIIENVSANPNLIEFLKNSNIDIPNKKQIENPKFSH